MDEPVDEAAEAPKRPWWPRLLVVVLVLLFLLCGGVFGLVVWSEMSPLQPFVYEL